jgi:hypothetical protein
MSQPPQGSGFPPPGGQPPHGAWPNAPVGQNPFGQPTGNPYADRPIDLNPYAPGTLPPPGSGHDPALGLVVPINTSIWAIAAGYLGLAAPILCFVPAPFAILCGVMALRELSRKPGTRGHVRAWVGIVLGTLWTLLGLVGLVGLVAGA